MGPDVRDTAAGGTLEAVSTLVMSANLYTEAEFSDLIVQAASGHGGVLSPRLLLGILFVAAGIGRSYLEIRRGRET